MEFMERFKSHEKSNLHRAAVSACQSLEKGVNIQTLMSKSEVKDTEDSRICLEKIFTTIRELLILLNSLWF